MEEPTQKEINEQLVARIAAIERRLDTLVGKFEAVSNHMRETYRAMKEAAQMLKWSRPKD